ncbi:MAG TPA: bifunctional phosphoribosyl-AMP cyclohydrolase/phosphoribosyl-ATP diphosphatase HisIE [Bacteroidales bacterium]|nr:bifunctional phosphoribosyl-AMP cyclohydrolase/phosphoribosyl-ATP diphosphatase HisIE [Bacteroidales bacterium]
MKDFNELDFEKNENGLIPAIIQDSKTLRVLMLGYMSKGSLAKTLETGLVTFFSRSKKRLWTKGESSGNFLRVVSMEIDCDGDTILIKVDPKGSVCHKGTLSCFGEENSEGFIRKLSGIIEDRHEQMATGSYTVKLLSEGRAAIAQKIGEEAVETVIEIIKGDKDRIIYEMSDLIYHLLVLLENEKISINEIEDELFSRHKI